MSFYSNDVEMNDQVRKSRRQRDMRSPDYCINDISVINKNPKMVNMSTTSQKHKNFVAEPMGDKSVTELAGVGEVLGKRLESQGYDKAYVVLGQFLVLKMNKELFQDWMKDVCQANAKQSADCFQCLLDWCGEFL